MSCLALYVLGPPEIERDGVPVKPHRRKAVALLVYLAVTGQSPGGRSHSRDSLATLLWPEQDQSRARAGLRRALASLKKALGEGWADGKHPLDVDRDSVGLNPAADVWLDVAEFREKLAECRMHGHLPDQLCPACLPLLTEAAAMYRDDFLAGFTLRDSPGFDEWQFFQTEDLRADLARPLERLVRGHGEQGQFEPAIAYARRWVALDPWHEPAHRCLMQLYAWSDQRAAALRQYSECERKLQEGLGVRPSEETTRLYQAIQEGRDLPSLLDRTAAPIPPRPASGAIMSASQRIADRFDIRDPDKDLLGRGSMGEVYRALDTHTGEPVAVKALDPRVVARDPGILEHFVREGEALRQLDHPNIVRMVAAVEDGGRHYLVMEYVAGGSLQDLLEAQRPDRSAHELRFALSGLSTPHVLEIALELADALTRAHHLGIIHRDLKPANVLLTEDGTPRLTDFGIARVSEGTRLFEMGVLVGTPDFLSPEACSGQVLDERTDIWAFGVLLFEMLTGETPFQGENLTAKLTAILTQPVPDLRERCPDAQEALVDLVYRMLEKDREQRIPSVRLVGAELEAILKGREVPTPVRLAPGESRFATPAPDTTQRRHNLPAQPTPFVGREAELTELARLLADPDVRLLTILGAGGMGKTRLALEAGAAQLDNFERGVYFVSLAPLQSAEAIVPATAEAVGFSFDEGGEPRQQLLDYLREKNKLLIMDNFEHLLAGPEPGQGDGAGLVTDVLQTAPEVKILSTSRARLNVQGEHLFRLTGMDFPDWETPEDAAEYSAFKLFLQSARRVRPGFELEADDLRYICRICRLVGGMPLGILLAAAWLDMLTPAEIADQISGEIEASLDFLQTDLRDVPERQRSMRAVFDHSWNLLTAREQEVFQALSVFRGGFTRQAAQRVATASLRELRSLVDKSLLQRDPTGRYGIHELLRQYAAHRLRRADKLGEAPAAECSVRDAHATYYAVFLASREAPLRGMEQRQVLEEIKAEVDNVRTAWDWAVTQGKVAEIEQSLTTLARFCRLRGWYREGEGLFSRAAQRLSGMHEERARLLRGKLLLQQGRFANLLGRETEEADRLLESSLAIFRELGARRDAAHAVCLLGGCERLSGSPRRELCLEGLSLFQELGDQRGIGLALYGLAWSAWHDGEYNDAKQSFEESLALFRQVSDPDGIQASLHGLGYICWILGEYERGRELHLEMLRLCRETGSQGGIARALGDLGIDAFGLRQYEKAHELFGQSLAIYRDIGNAIGMYDELGDLAEAANALGDYVQAEQYIREAFRVLPEGEADYDRGSWEYRNLGNAACGLGNYADARKHLHRSLELAVAAQRPSRHLLTFVGVARVLAKQGDEERALELLALVMNHRFSWQMAKDQATPLIAELEAELPPEVVASAKARGRARDLDATVAELLVELAGNGTDSLDQPAGLS